MTKIMKIDVFSTKLFMSALVAMIVCTHLMNIGSNTNARALKAEYVWEKNEKGLNVLKHEGKPVNCDKLRQDYDGGWYDGEWKDGLPNGQGRWQGNLVTTWFGEKFGDVKRGTWKNGTLWDGQWWQESHKTCCGWTDHKRLYRVEKGNSVGLFRGEVKEDMALSGNLAPSLGNWENGQFVGKRPSKGEGGYGILDGVQTGIGVLDAASKISEALP